MSAPDGPARLGPAFPFFIVRDVLPALAFYRDRLGFTVTFLGPDDDPYIAVVERDAAGFILKAITPEVLPMPNPSRHGWAAWDAYVHTPDPDALAAELASRDVALHRPLADTPDRLRGFEVQDGDGYILFFGRPV